MRFISKAFLTGMATVLPILITVYLLFWFAIKAESLLGGLIQNFVPETWYRPGLGLGLSLLLILAVGILMHAWFVRRLIHWGERLLYRVPLVRSLYGSIRDFFTLFSKTGAESPHQPVMVRLGDTDLELMGFVMREDFSGLPQDLCRGDRIAVYLPLSYQIGGYTAMIPRSAIRTIDMPMEQAMRFTLTAGLTTAPPGSNSARGAK